MLPGTSKEQLIKLFLSRDLFSWVMKKGLVKKGDTYNYAHLLDLTTDDLLAYFESNQYPGLKTPPPSQENEYTWKLEAGVYTVLFIDRGTDFSEYSTSSKEEFQAWWKKYILDYYSRKLHYDTTL